MKQLFFAHPRKMFRYSRAKLFPMLAYLFQNIGVFIGFSWFGSVTMYAVLLLPEKLYEFDLKGIKVSLFCGISLKSALILRLYFFVSDVCTILWF